MISDNCIKRIGRILNFIAVASVVSYFYRDMMLEAGGVYVDVDPTWHIIIFVVTIIPGVYLTKFYK